MGKRFDFVSNALMCPPTKTRTRAVKRELKRERENAGARQTIKRSETDFIARIRARVYTTEEKSQRSFNGGDFLKVDFPANHCLQRKSIHIVRERTRNGNTLRGRTEERERDRRKAELL